MRGEQSINEDEDEGLKSKKTVEMRGLQNIDDEEDEQLLLPRS